MVSQPLGTVTFMFTDVEDSTRLWESHPTDMGAALARHDAILRAVVAEHHGHVFTTAGDSFAVAFARAHDAVNAAVKIQRRLADEPSPAQSPIRVRMGLHTGEAQERDGDYFGSAVNRAARVMALAAGDQILVTAATHDVVSDADLGELGFLDLAAHRLKGLTKPEKLYQLTGPGLRNQFPPIDSGITPQSNLPSFGEELIGRGSAISDLRGLLDGHRLVTVTGVGGIGKTRAAIEVAAGLAGHYPDGVWYGELAPIGQPEAVAAAVGQVLGVRQHPARSMIESIAEFGRHRQMLLVIDNCEHVLDAAADLIEAVIAASTGVTVLATSREALGCRGEQAYPLRSLDTSTVGAAATSLFVRRAAEVEPTRSWTQDDLAVIGRICSRLDGIPLAIELAASRTTSLHPSEIEERLGAAFRTLRGGRRAVERHRTLEAAIDWSYEMLDEPARVLFERVAVFSGGFDLSAAEAVGADGDLVEPVDVADLLDDLVTKSLVVADLLHSGHTRYRLLEPLRQYAEDRLAGSGTADDARNRHLDHYTRWAEHWESDIPAEGTEWTDRLRREFPNLRTAVAWAVATNDTERSAQVVASLWPAVFYLQMLEVGDWAEAVLELATIGDTPLGPHVAGIAASARHWRSDIAESLQFAELAIAMPAADLSSRFPAIIEANLLERQGRVAEATARLGLIVPTHPVAAAERAWLRASKDAQAAAVATDLATLREQAERTHSLLIHAMHQSTRAQIAFGTGDTATASDASHLAIEHALRMGAPFFVHINVPTAVSAAATLGQVTHEDLGLIRSSLREQRDAGLELDQWLILAAAAKALLRYGHIDLAIQVAHGCQTSPWRRISPTWIHKLMDGVDDRLTAPAPDSNTPQDLESMVDRVLIAIDRILHTS